MINLLTMFLAVVVGLITGCRLKDLHISTHKPGWLLLHLAFAWGAVAAVGEAWQGEATWSALPFLVGVAAYLWLSRVTWHAGPPPFTRRDYMGA